MKKLLTIMLLLTVTAAAFAQDDVTKFLGIPVDGTKSAMIQKLKAKGFTYNSAYGWLEGEFNGYDVYVSVVTNNNKVWRIMVQDANASSETDIKIRFNGLCRQFEKNQRYIPVIEESQTLSDKEDIDYEMTIHNKRYEAVYYQKTDSAIITEKLLAYLHTKYTNEQIQKRIDAVEEDGTKFLMDLTSKKSVWFMINKDGYGEYRILMFYDNENNHSDGEDL